jgi:hypothetical protein
MQCVCRLTGACMREIGRIAYNAEQRSENRSKTSATGGDENSITEMRCRKWMAYIHSCHGSNSFAKLRIRRKCGWYSGSFWCDLLVLD